MLKIPFQKNKKNEGMPCLDIPSIFGLNPSIQVLRDYSASADAVIIPPCGVCRRGRQPRGRSAQRRRCRGERSGYCSVRDRERRERARHHGCLRCPRRTRRRRVGRGRHLGRRSSGPVQGRWRGSISAFSSCVGFVVVCLLWLLAFGLWRAS